MEKIELENLVMRISDLHAKELTTYSDSATLEALEQCHKILSKLKEDGAGY